MDDWVTPTDSQQDSGHFDSVVVALRRQARIDETTSLASAAVAMTLREELDDTVPVERPASPDEPDVMVDESIGVVVVADEEDDDRNLIFEVMDDEELERAIDEDPDDTEAIELPVGNTAALDHLVVYANETTDTDAETWERLQSEYTASKLGLTAVSFVGGPTGSAF